jgi:hypothetical protein
MAPQYFAAIQDKKMSMMLYMACPTIKEVTAQLLNPVAEQYTAMANTLNVPCAPVIHAFVLCSEKRPDLALIDNQSDRKYALDKVNTHQSPFGTYVAACTLFAAIYGQSPVGLTFHAAFDGKTEVPFAAEDATFAQEIAWQAWQSYAAKRPAAEKKR